MKRKYLIYILLIIVLVLGTGAYLYFFKIKPTVTAPVTTITSDNPFGTSNAARPDNRIKNADGSVTIPVIALTHIYTDPVAGAAITEDKSDENARIVDRGTGHIYNFNFTTGLLTQSTNTTIPKIQEATWSQTAKNVVYRFMEDGNDSISTYSGKILLPTSTSTEIFGSLQGSFLPSDITSIAISPSGKSLAFVAKGTNGSQIISSNIDGTKLKNLYSSPLYHWNISWPTEATIALTTSPSSQTPGFLYFLSTSGNLRKVLGNINGLTVNIDPTGTYIAYSNSTNSLAVYNTKTNTSTQLDISTLAEKCVWSKLQKGVIYCGVPTSIPRGDYPDNWYQGSVSFTDTIYKINTQTKINSVIGDLPVTFKESVDAINLVLSPQEDYLLFTNKKDLSLWSLKLN